MPFVRERSAIDERHRRRIPGPIASQDPDQILTFATTVSVLASVTFLP